MLTDVIGGLQKCLLTTETSECRVSSQLQQTMLLNTDTVCLFTPRIRFFRHFLSKLSLATILFLPHPQFILWPHSDLTPSTPHVPRSSAKNHPPLHHFLHFFPLPVPAELPWWASISDPCFPSQYTLAHLPISFPVFFQFSSTTTGLPRKQLCWSPSLWCLLSTFCTSPSSLLCSIFLIPTFSSDVSVLKHPKQKQSNLISVVSSHGATLWDQCTCNLTSTQQSTILNKVQILKDLTDKDYKELEIGQVNRLGDRNPCSMLQR